MKQGLHPKYEKTIIKCACGNSFETRSTVFPEIHVELCSVCHPFYTGKQKFVDTAGRVDKFRARMEAASKNSKAKISNDKSGAKENSRTNQEKLAEIKKEASKPIVVEQEISSNIELVAEEELKDNR